MISAEGVTERGRVAAESLMVDACLVERQSGVSVMDPVTGVVTFPWVTIYEGKCKLQGRQAQSLEVSAAGHLFSVEQLMVHLPISAQSQVGDRVTVVGSRDPDLVGLQLRLTELARGSYRTADRWNVELVTS